MRLRIMQSQIVDDSSGEPCFVLEARAHLEDLERATIERLRLGDDELYPRVPSARYAQGQSAPSDLTITINDVVHGRRFESTSLRDALDVRKALVEACERLWELLDFGKDFDGVHAFTIGPDGTVPRESNDPTLNGLTPEPTVSTRTLEPVLGGIDDTTLVGALPIVDDVDATQNIRMYKGKKIIVHAQFGLFETQVDGTMFQTMEEAKAHIDSL